jgi:hypothetical protein
MPGPVPGIHVFLAAYSTVILRSRALARRLEGSPKALVAHPSRLAQEGEHLRMTAVLFYALKYAICVVVASRRPLGDHSSPLWSP